MFIENGSDYASEARRIYGGVVLFITTIAELLSNRPFF